MDIGIIGLPQSGKTTIFNCLTGGHAETSGYGGQRANIGVAKVPDPRLDALAKIFGPKRMVPAEVRFVDVPFAPRGLGRSEGFGGELLNMLSRADALLHVVRQFKDPSVSHIEGSVDPYRDIEMMDLELAFSDLAILERKQVRLEEGLKGARGSERERLLKEQELIGRVKAGLEAETTIREQGLSDEEEKTLRNYQFLTAKPMLLALNIGEEDLDEEGKLEAELNRRCSRPGVRGAAVCGKLEEELSQLEESEAEAFRSEMEVGEPAASRILKLSFELLGLVSFLTGGPEEVHAWPVPRDTEAVKAAGKIHSDLERGFIRAEVIGYEDLIRCGSMAEARKRGLLRAEGKQYRVQDGDVVHVLFSV